MTAGGISIGRKDKWEMKNDKWNMENEVRDSKV